MYGLPTMDAASRVRAPLVNTLPTNAKISSFAEKIESISNCAGIPPIISQNASKIEPSNLYTFFSGWSKVEHFPTCRSQSGSEVAGCDVTGKMPLKKSQDIMARSGFSSAKKGQAPLPQSQAVVHFSSAKKGRAPLPPSQAVMHFSSAKKGRAPLPPSQAVMHFKSAKKGRAPLPPSQAAQTATHRLAVDSDVSTVASHNKNHKKGFLGHLRAMWKRIDLPLIDILSPKY